MFYCEPCGEKNDWPTVRTSVILRRSLGPCEVCRKVSLCYDVPSSQLGPKPLRLEDALAKWGGWEEMTDFEEGFVKGMMEYSWMRDGVTYVGTTGRTLGDAVDRFLAESRERQVR